VYRDQGQCDAKDERPALTALMNDLPRRKADVVVVWALDRMAHSLKRLLATCRRAPIVKGGLSIPAAEYRYNVASVKIDVCGIGSGCRI
jgi:Resolvase, N terminal domain